MAKILQAIIDRLEGRKAVLRFGDGQQLIVEKDFFAFKITEGQLIKVSLVSGNNKSAKIAVSRLLNEIKKENQHEGKGKIKTS